MIATMPTPHTGRLAAIPAPRRLPAALAIVASAGVFTTSLRALPPAVLFPLAAAWLAAFAVGALAPRAGVVILTVLAALVKTATVLMVIWVITRPHSAIGPHGALDWVPLGMLNAATGLWLLAVIRHRAR
jgi:4-amino-4-deoxy-L-arabinose transferase-like glycosyltransferase